MKTLRDRLNLAFVVPTAVIVLVLVGVAYLAGRQGFEDEMERRLEAVAQVLAVDMSEGLDAAQIGRLDESMNRVRQRLTRRLADVEEHSDVQRVFIFDDQSRRLVDTGETEGFGETLYRIGADRSEVQQAFDQQIATSGTLYRSEDGTRHKRAYAPIVYDGETVAAVGVEASADYFDLLTGVATVLTLLGALGIAVVAVIGIWFSRWLLRPVDTLVDGAQRLADGDLQTPVVGQARRDWTQTEEFDFLMASFEEMRQSIVERDEQMQMMLSGIAHEVRNPLGGMELFCGLLREDLESHTDQRREQELQKVERIERELAYLKDVVDSFLEFARPGELSIERVQAASIIDEVVELVEQEARDRGCRLEVDIGADLELTVDCGQLRRALINVVRNAVQAGGDKEGATVVIRCVGDGDDRCIEVVDDGCGIAQEQLQQLCRPFYTTREQGSGLGLALTRKIVERHGGELEINSVVNEGTTVRLIVPFDDNVTTRADDISDDGQPQRSVPEGWLG